MLNALMANPCAIRQCDRLQHLIKCRWELRGTLRVSEGWRNDARLRRGIGGLRVLMCVPKQAAEECHGKAAYWQQN